MLFRKHDGSVQLVVHVSDCVVFVTLRIRTDSCSLSYS